MTFRLWRCLLLLVGLWLLSVLRFKPASAAFWFSCVRKMEFLAIFFPASCYRCIVRWKSTHFLKKRETCFLSNWCNWEKHFPIVAWSAFNVTIMTPTNWEKDFKGGEMSRMKETGCLKSQGPKFRLTFSHTKLSSIKCQFLPRDRIDIEWSAQMGNTPIFQKTKNFADSAFTSKIFCGKSA